MKKKFVLAAAAAALLSLSSCDKLSRTESVTDLGFELRTEVAYDADYLCSTLSLSLAGGSDGEYTFNYSIDAGATQKLTELSGSTVESGEKIELSRSNAYVLMLPKLSGSHRLAMELTNGSAVRRDTVSFSAESAVAVRVDAGEGLDFSRVTLIGRSAQMGTYTVAFSLDGETLQGIKYLGSETGGEAELDFSASSAFVFELPYILPGEHSESTTYKNRPFFLKVTLKVTGKVTRKSIRCDRMRCNGVQVRKITPRVN